MRDWLSEKILAEPKGGMVHREANNALVSTIPRTDGIDIYIGRKDVDGFKLSMDSSIKLARFLLRWWIFYTWFGLKPRLVRWAFDHRLRREHEKALEDLAGRKPSRRRRRPTP